MTQTYSSYLKLEELLSLQEPLSHGSAHDETLFIIIHQAYELWFKEILHEMDYFIDALEQGDLGKSQFTLRRILVIQKVLLDQLDVLETMTAGQFRFFRKLLGTASGFQSSQFRELEFLLGNKRPEVFLSFPEGSEPRKRLEMRLSTLSLWDAFMRFLSRQGYPIPTEALQRDFSKPSVPSEAIQAALVDIYSKESGLSLFCEMLLDLDEKFQEWRYRHVKMVERIIGAKQGTGGSTGVEYLKTTLSNPCFPDLWTIRADFYKP
jgi:tryptophan 2,3-dioxygenase